MKRFYMLSLAVLASTSLFAQFVGNGGEAQGVRAYLNDNAWAPREHHVDFLHMRLEINFDVAQGLVKGKVTHRFTPLQQQVDSIWLDGPGIRILEASLNGKAVSYRTEAQGTWVKTGRTLTWGEKDSLQVVYEANPRKGLYFIGWNDPAGICRKQIWSQGQGIDNRNWIPFYDEMNDKITTEMIVTFDAKYKVLSNGLKIKEKDNKDGTKTWHYRMSKPSPPYLVMLGIGDYEIKQTKSKSGVPMNLYYYPEWKDRVEATYRYSEQMVDFFEAEIGVNYPWESYSQIPVQEFMYGAMENTTATVFGDFLFVDERSELDRAYVGVNAHELAHQWFGDYVTARSDAHHWLQESFATYYNMMFEREVYGADYFDWARFNGQTASVAETKKNLFPVAHSEAGSTRHYPKGAFVLNMLKNVCGGREAYNKAIKYYLQKHPYGNVDSHDLLVAFHETLGLSLDWFWDEWIYRGGEPMYNVTATDMTGSNGKRQTRFTVEQVHSMSETVGLFKMPIWFEVHYADGTSERQQAWIEKVNHTVDVPNNAGKKISYVLFDPNNEVMKTVNFVKPVEWLKNQAVQAKSMLDRRDALVAMRELPLDEKRNVLIAAYGHEKFHAPKGEIISQLITDTDPAALALLRNACADNDANVQKAVLSSTTKINKTLLADYEKLLQSKSYEVVASALEQLCFEFPENTNRYLDMTKGVTGTAGRNVEIKWLEVKAGASNDADALNKLVAYANESYEFRTRVNAAQALKRLNFCNEQLVKNLMQAVFSANTRLANPCVETLRHFYGQAQYRRMIGEFLDRQKWKPWEKKIVSRITG